jgi:predicted nuclease of predicted toxin-antitoxin system
LLDSCVAAQAKSELMAAGHDVDATGDWPNDPGDDEILAHAFKAGRILVKDFGELAVVRGRLHVGILRLVDVRAGLQGRSCAAALEKYAQELAGGAIVTVEPSRVRVRPAG